MNTTIEIPRYRCHKEVQALKIAAIIPNPRGFELHFEDKRFCPIEVPIRMIREHEPDAGWYFVIYPGGYQSFSPSAAFESGYTLIS